MCDDEDDYDPATILKSRKYFEREREDFGNTPEIPEDTPQENQRRKLDD